MLLRHPSTFRRLWLGQSISVVGDGMQRVALLWWAKHHGGNGLLAAVALSTMVPVVIGSPVGGWLADRTDRRALMLVADLVRLATSGALATLLFTEPSSAPVCGLLAIAGLATAVFDPAYSSAVPTVVADADLPAANGLNMSQGAIGGLVGPLLGGLLIGVTDIGWVMVVNAGTFLWSAAFVATCRLPRERGGGERLASPPARGGVRSALAGMRTVPGLGRLLVLASTLNMVVAPVPMLIAALAIDRLGAGPQTFGLLEMLLSAGLLAGALFAGQLARGHLGTSFVVLGVCLAVTGVLPLGGVAAALVTAGVAIAIANTEAMTLFQRGVPAELHGRVFGVLGSLSEGLRPAGLALGAPLLAAAGVSGALGVVGGGVILATLACGRGITADVLAARGSAGGVAPAPALALDRETDELVDER